MVCVCAGERGGGGGEGGRGEGKGGGHVRDEGDKLALLALCNSLLEGLHLVGVRDLVGNEVCRGEVDLDIELSGYTALDSEHLPEGGLVSVVDFKLVPGVPELRVNPWIGQLGGEGVNRPGAVNLAELFLEFGELEGHVASLPVVKNIDCLLEDLSSRGDSVGIAGLLDIPLKHPWAAFLLHSRGSPVKDLHHIAGETVIFLQFCVHQVDILGKLRRALLQRLFKEIP